MKPWNERQLNLLFWSLFVIILLSGTILRLTGIDWGSFSDPDNAITFHPDEPKILLIAKPFLKETIQLNLDTNRALDYVKGLSYQTALLSNLIHTFTGSFNTVDFYMTGRYLVLSYGIATLLVIFALTFILTHNRWKSLFAMGFLATASLHIENSHYATADVPVTFWLYLGILLACWEHTKHHFLKMLGLAICMGFACATKLSFLLLFPLFFLCSRSRVFSFSILFYLSITILSFCFANGFDYSYSHFKTSWNMLIHDNLSIRQHWEGLNPFVYFFQLLPAVGLPAFIFILFGFCKGIKIGWIRLKRKKIHWPFLFMFLFPLLVYFAVICFLDLPFARHILPLIPSACVLAATQFYNLVQVLIQKKAFKLIAVMGIGLILYQWGYSYSVQYYFDHDPRGKTIRWVNKNVPKNAHLAITAYVYAPRGYRILPNLDNHLYEADYLILHESYYYRYLRSELNPLRAPEKISEVYRGTKKNLYHMKLLFANKLPFEKVKTFHVRAFTPELLLYKKILGTFPHFLGDMMIYKKITRDDNQ